MPIRSLAAGVLAALLLAAPSLAQPRAGAAAGDQAAHRTGPPPGYRDPTEGRKKVLFVGDLQTGVPAAHDWSMSHAAAVLERLGRETGAYDLYIQTDTHLITKAQTHGGGPTRAPGAAPPAGAPPRMSLGRNLDYFDAVVFYTNGDMNMSGQQVKDLLAFVHDDGKGFVGIHTATATLTKVPAYGEMVGAVFDNHPWGIIEAPIVVEEPSSPMMKRFKTGMEITDEMYQMRAQPYSRADVDVLARLDASKLDLKAPSVHRADGDFPIAWIKSYGQGRVFYSGLGHPPKAWDDPRIQAMYLEAIKWALHETDEAVRPHPLVR